jgi:hypothetical protein
MIRTLGVWPGAVRGTFTHHRPNCHNRVAHQGALCYHHVDQWRRAQPPSRPAPVYVPEPMWQPDPVRQSTPQPPGRRERDLNTEQQERLHETAQWIVGLGMDGWQETVASHAADCLDEKTWNRLFGRPRRRNCTILANTAAALLEGKKQLHDATSRLAGLIARGFGAEPIEEAVVRQLTDRIPFPLIDQKTVAAARGLQMIGIAICALNQQPINRCQCFIDLSLVETKTHVETIMAGALGDWTSSSSPIVAAWSSGTGQPH